MFFRTFGNVWRGYGCPLNFNKRGDCLKNFDLLVPQPELGRTAKELRESLGIGVEEMAKRLETTRQTIYNFESGQRQSMKILQGYLKLKG